MQTDTNQDTHTSHTNSKRMGEREQMLIRLLINKRQNNFSENYLRKCENWCVCVY